MTSEIVISTLKERFAGAWDEVQVEGDEPLWLDDPAYAYLTQKPHHHLFSVGHGRTGRREHVAECRAGQLLFALPPEAVAKHANPTMLLLSGPAGSRVLRVPSRLVFEAMADLVVERSFDDWIELLVAALPAAPVPKRCDAVEVGPTLGPTEGPLRAKSGVVWLELAERPTHYRSLRIEEHAEALPRAWPLTATSWISGGAATGARISGSADLFGRTNDASFAEAFYAFVVSVLARRRVELERTRLGLDAASQDSERELVDAALRSLAQTGTGEENTGERGSDALGIAWPRAAERPRSLGEIQSVLSHAGSIRSRKVLLEGAWYEDDCGPLLGFMLDDGDEVNDDRLSPVALLPAASGYRLHRAGRSSERVTKAVAERLHPRAYQIYPTLPDRPLTPFDVLRFSSRGSLRDVVFVFGIGAVLGSLSMLIPMLTGKVFDDLIPGRERALLVQAAVVLALVYVGQGLFDVARGLAQVRVQTRMDGTLEAAVWDRLLDLPLPFFRNYSAGDLASRAAGIGKIRDILAGATLTAILGGLFSLWNLGFLFAMDAGLAAVALALVVVALVPAALATRRGLARQSAVAAIDGKIDGLLLQLLHGIAMLRVAAAENRAFATWAKLFSRRRDADVAGERIVLLADVFRTAYPLICTMVLYAVLAGAGRQRLSTGMFLAFTSAFGIFLASTLAVIDSVLRSLAVVPLYDRARPILEAHGERHAGGDRPELGGRIEVNHVSFRYDPKAPLVLEDVSFRVEPGEFVALVGPSGSGKSTLLRLLLGFEAASEGGVFYDGRALGGLDVREVRKQIGVVMQNSRVLSGDVFSNIVGTTGLGHEDAWKAARRASLDRDIEAMPMGMSTVITPGGGMLSGGQRQRLLIARALATDPRIVFFDEATSALDNVTQAAVTESLQSLRITRIVVAHRLSTIRQADKIIVLDRGRVAQMGPFEELVAIDGPFKKLAERQVI